MVVYEYIWFRINVILHISFNICWSLLRSRYTVLFTTEAFTEKIPGALQANRVSTTTEILVGKVSSSGSVDKVFSHRMVRVGVRYVVSVQKSGYMASHNGL